MKATRWDRRELASTSSALESNNCTEPSEHDLEQLNICISVWLGVTAESVFPLADTHGTVCFHVYSTVSMETVCVSMVCTYMAFSKLAGRGYVV